MCGGGEVYRSMDVRVVSRAHYNVRVCVYVHVLFHVVLNLFLTIIVICLNTFFFLFFFFFFKSFVSFTCYINGMFQN